MLLSFFFLFSFSDFPVFLFCPSRKNNKIEEIPPPSPLETDDRNRWRLSCPPGVSSLPTCLVFSIRSKIETDDRNRGLSCRHEVSSHLQGLLHQIKDRNWWRTTSVWLLTGIPSPSPPVPRTTLFSSRSLVVPLVSSSPPDQRSLPRTDSVWLLMEIPPTSCEGRGLCPCWQRLLRWR